MAGHLTLVMKSTYSGYYVVDSDQNILSIDVGLPLEIDDEFWSPPDENNHSIPLRQPDGQPSIISAFNVYARVSLIYDWVIRTLVSLDSPPHTLARILTLIYPVIGSVTVVRS